MEKNIYDKAYDDGYKEGKEDDGMDNFMHSMTKGYHMPLSDEKVNESYNAGYADGAADYYDEDNSSYRGKSREIKNYKGAKQRDDEEEQHEKQLRQREQQLARERQREQEQSEPQTTSSDNDSEGCLVKIIGFVIAAAAVIWFVSQIAIPLIIINVATIGLIASFVKVNWKKGLLALSALGSILIVLDYNNGWATKALVENVSFFKGSIPYFFYLNIATGLVAAYFLIRNYLNEKQPPAEGEVEFSKRNLIVIGCLVLAGGLTIGGQEYFDAKRPTEIPLQSAPGIAAFVQTKQGSTLLLRAAPSEQTAVLANIPNGAALSILRYDDHFTKVNGEKGKWCQVNYNGTIGWAWGGFLKVGEKDGQPATDNSIKLTPAEAKKLIGKQMVIDKIKEQRCLGQIDSFAEINVINLNEGAQQYIVSAPYGLCGPPMNAACIDYWVYEYMNNSFRLLGTIECIKGSVRTIKTRTNGYLDIEAISYVGAYGDKFVFRFKYNGKEYKSK